jgi:hypothetical protein
VETKGNRELGYQVASGIGKSHTDSRRQDRVDHFAAKDQCATFRDFAHLLDAVPRLQ